MSCVSSFTVCFVELVVLLYCLYSRLYTAYLLFCILYCTLFFVFDIYWLTRVRSVKTRHVPSKKETRSQFGQSRLRFMLSCMWFHPYVQPSGSPPALSLSGHPIPHVNPPLIRVSTSGTCNYTIYGITISEDSASQFTFISFASLNSSSFFVLFKRRIVQLIISCVWDY